MNNWCIIDEVCKFNGNEINTKCRPRRTVIREAISTTQIRIVFDASSTDKLAKSLNRCSFSSPSLKFNILDIILRGCIHFLGSQKIYLFFEFIFRKGVKVIEI